MLDHSTSIGELTKNDRYFPSDQISEEKTQLATSLLQLTTEDDVSQGPLKPDITLNLNQLETLVTNQRGLKIANLNINSLCKHIDELRINMADQIIHILGINETKLDLSVPQHLISLKGYTWVSRDRNGFGGGVGFYIKNSINFHVRSDLNRDNIEFLTIEISKDKIKPFLISTWYRPPNSPIDLFNKFESILRHIEEKESIILGDLNCDLLNKSQEDYTTKELNFITNLYQYYQLIDEPTRETICSKLLIDHFYSNRKQNIVLAGVSRITISDHYLIYGIKKFLSLKGE